MSVPRAEENEECDTNESGTDKDAKGTREKCEMNHYFLYKLRYEWFGSYSSRIFTHSSHVRVTLFSMLSHSWDRRPHDCLKHSKLKTFVSVLRTGKMHINVTRTTEKWTRNLNAGGHATQTIVLTLSVSHS